MTTVSPSFIGISVKKQPTPRPSFLSCWYDTDSIPRLQPIKARPSYACFRYSDPTAKFDWLLSVTSWLLWLQHCRIKHVMYKTF
jgi:hypothetical protein